MNTLHYILAGKFESDTENKIAKMDDGLMVLMEATFTSVPEANSSCAQNYCGQIIAKVDNSVIAAFANHFVVNKFFIYYVLTNAFSYHNIK